MKAEDAAEMMESQKESDTFKQRAAVAIACFAMVLAICGLGGSNAGKEAVNNNVLASNFFSFYRAKNAADRAGTHATRWLNDPTFPDAAKQAMRAKLASYRATIARYESEPSTNEGKKELMTRARDHEKLRDRAQAGPVFRLRRGAAADRDRADLGVDHRQPLVAGVPRRRGRA